MLYAVIAVIVVVVYFIVRSNNGTTPYLPSSKNTYQTIDDEFNAKKKVKQENIDRILEKINDKGVNSLTKQEKVMLDEYSNSN
ncbi:hypothetical protein IMCC3317_44910 [Kordia antarctica]|uniref:DUF6576 domain-containing protein n=1 Tax=Kordia antarctica TaxID=1218801 RepID=A0A7L4ZRI8_9FLAO|nr:DUF6576 domain-containing protein [Kordia antarctica]QHI39090.1 hypothetical protein IMCC3317_44910 [Kordia antarctica]